MADVDVWKLSGTLAMVVLVLAVVYLAIRNPLVGQGRGRVLVVSLAVPVAVFAAIALVVWLSM